MPARTPKIKDRVHCCKFRSSPLRMSRQDRYFLTAPMVIAYICISAFALMSQYSTADTPPPLGCKILQVNVIFFPHKLMSLHRLSKFEHRKMWLEAAWKSSLYSLKKLVLIDTEVIPIFHCIQIAIFYVELKVLICRMVNGVYCRRLHPSLRWNFIDRTQCLMTSVATWPASIFFVSSYQKMDFS
jgi:hypothetical protein